MKSTEILLAELTQHQPLAVAIELSQAEEEALGPRNANAFSAFCSSAIPLLDPNSCTNDVRREFAEYRWRRAIQLLKGAAKFRSIECNGIRLAPGEQAREGLALLSAAFRAPIFLIPGGRVVWKMLCFLMLCVGVALFLHFALTSSLILMMTRL